MTTSLVIRGLRFSPVLATVCLTGVMGCAVPTDSESGEDVDSTTESADALPREVARPRQGAARYNPEGRANASNYDGQRTARREGSRKHG